MVGRGKKQHLFSGTAVLEWAYTVLNLRQRKLVNEETKE